MSNEEMNKKIKKSGAKPLLFEPLKVVGPDQKPKPHPFYGDSYVRGQDPFHIDAFPHKLVEQLDSLRFHDTNTGKVLNPVINCGERKSGWFLQDAYGNFIGFTPDGTQF